MTTPTNADIIALYRGRAGLPGATFAEFVAAIPSSPIALPIQDDGAEVVAVPTALNFTGAGVVVTDVADVATIAVPGDIPVPIQDETVEVVAVPTAINFEGAGVVVTDVADVATVTIPGGGVADLEAFKSADTSRFNDATLTDDPDLTLPLTNGRWRVKLELISFSASATPDIRVGFNASAGLVVDNATYRFKILTVGSTGGGVDNDGFNSGITNQATLAIPAGITSLSTFTGSFNVTTAGVYTLKWAQAVSDGTPVIVRQNSVLTAHRLGDV